MSCIVYGSVKCDNYNDMNYLFVTITYTLITFTVPFYVLLNVAFYVLAISLSNFKLYHKNSVRVCVCTQSFSTLCNPMDCHPLGSIGFSRQDYWSGLLFLTPGDLPKGSNLGLLCLLHWQEGSLSPGNPSTRTNRA